MRYILAVLLFSFTCATLRAADDADAEAARAARAARAAEARAKFAEKTPEEQRASRLVLCKSFLRDIANPNFDERTKERWRKRLEQYTQEYGFTADELKIEEAPVAKKSQTDAERKAEELRKFQREQEAAAAKAAADAAQKPRVKRSYE